MNKEEQREYNKQYRIKNREKALEYAKQYRKKLDPIKKKEYNRQYRIKNKEKIIENNRIYGKQYRIKNREKLAEKYKQYNINNREKANERQMRYYFKHREEVREYQKQYRKDNPGKMKERARQNSEKRKQYYIKNKEKIIEKIKQWRKDNPEKRRIYLAKKLRTDLKFNLSCKMAISIRRALKSNKAGRRWESLTGYTLAELIKRLNNTIPEDYTWQDFLMGKLHIDHIIPKKVFNYTKPEHQDFKKCWALSNLQLLPAKENLIKNDRLYKPFQPALQI